MTDPQYAKLMAEIDGICARLDRRLRRALDDAALDLDRARAKIKEAASALAGDQLAASVDRERLRTENARRNP